MFLSSKKELDIDKMAITVQDKSMMQLTKWTNPDNLPSSCWDWIKCSAYNSVFIIFNKINSIPDINIYKQIAIPKGQTISFSWDSSIHAQNPRSSVTCMMTGYNLVLISV